jgi:hypothetical protein
MFMHEFKTIKSAAGIESLRTTLKNEELERYGDPFTPEFVYEAIRQLPRFASMRVCCWPLTIFHELLLTGYSEVISKMLRNSLASCCSLLMTSVLQFSRTPHYLTKNVGPVLGLVLVVKIGSKLAESKRPPFLDPLDLTLSAPSRGFLVVH